LKSKFFLKQFNLQITSYQKWLLWGRKRGNNMRLCRLLLLWLVIYENCWFFNFFSQIRIYVIHFYIKTVFITWSCIWIYLMHHNASYYMIILQWCT
jgi:hypothetical protein